MNKGYNMRFSITLETKKATSRIQYKLVKSIGFTTVYQIMKYDCMTKTATYIVRNICSYDAAMLIWSDVLAGKQK